jgi:phage baseplate assembly protein W
MAKAINVDYPIIKGNTGFFKQTFDTLSAVKSKIYVLLKTMPGERPFNPDFGLGLYKYVFEPITTDTIQIISSEIQRKVAMYIPEVNINNLEINTDFNTNADQNILKIKLEFALKNNPALQDTINLEVSA